MIGTIPRTSVLLTLVSAVFVWMALSALAGVAVPDSGPNWLMRIALAGGAFLMAAGLFSAATVLIESAREAEASAKAVRVRVVAQVRRQGR